MAETDIIGWNQLKEMLEFPEEERMIIGMLLCVATWRIHLSTTLRFPQSSLQSSPSTPLISAPSHSISLNLAFPRSLPSPAPHQLKLTISKKKKKDVREPHELADTGRIPGAVSMPLNSNPNAIFLAPELFYRTFGFIKPGTSRAEAMIPETGEGEAKKADSAAAAAVGSREGVDKDDGKAEVRVNEVIFYCKTGVRSKMAAHMAMNEIGWVPGVQSADLKGGWVEWLARGGKVEKVGE